MHKRKKKSMKWLNYPSLNTKINYYTTFPPFHFPFLSFPLAWLYISCQFNYAFFFFFLFLLLPIFFLFNSDTLKNSLHSKTPIYNQFQIPLLFPPSLFLFFFHFLNFLLQFYKKKRTKTLFRNWKKKVSWFPFCLFLFTESWSSWKICFFFFLFNGHVRNAYMKKNTYLLYTCMWVNGVEQIKKLETFFPCQLVFVTISTNPEAPLLERRKNQWLHKFSWKKKPKRGLDSNLIVYSGTGFQESSRKKRCEFCCLCNAETDIKVRVFLSLMTLFLFKLFL